MSAQSLIARLAEQRRHWAELPGGVRVRLSRPHETEFARFRLGITVEHVCEYVDGWEGVTEAVVLGPSIGSDAPVPFDAALWRELVRDRIDWVPPVAEAIAKAITDHLAAKDATAKN